MNLLPFFYQSSLLYLLEESSTTLELEKIYSKIPMMNYEELITPSFISRFSSLSFGEFFTLLYEIDKKHSHCIKYYIEQALLKSTTENKLFIHRFYVLIQLRQLKHLFIDSTCQMILSLLKDPLIQIHGFEDIVELLDENITTETINNETITTQVITEDKNNETTISTILTESENEEDDKLIENYNKINESVGDNEDSTYSFINDMKIITKYPSPSINMPEKKSPQDIIDLLQELNTIFDSEEEDSIDLQSEEENNEKSTTSFPHRYELETLREEDDDNELMDIFLKDNDEEEDDDDNELMDIYLKDNDEEEEDHDKEKSNLFSTVSVKQIIKIFDSSDVILKDSSNYYHSSFQKKKEYFISIDSLNSVLIQYPLS